jgi:hypothetical protein
MALTGPRAQALLSEVLKGIRPHLPAGFHVEMLPHRKWTTLARNSPDGGYATTVRGIGAPTFFPLRARAKPTVKHAVELVLQVAYWLPEMGGQGDQQDFDVRAVVTGDEVFVSYRPPGADPDARIELPPIALGML